MSTILRIEAPYSGGRSANFALAGLAALPLSLIILKSIITISLPIRFPLDPYAWVDTIYDDGYYYLGVARHLSLGQGSMFAPPLVTNGYQPLWLLILAGVSLLSGGDRATLVAATHVTILLGTLTFSFIAWRQEGRHWPAAITAFCFSFALMYGLETVLIPPLSLLYFRANSWKRGGLAGLLFLARLDTLGLIIGREVFEGLIRRRFDARPTAVLLPVILIYAALNLYVFGTAVPVSGLAKAVGNVPGENWRVGVLLIFKALPVAVALALIWRVSGKLRNPMPIFASMCALACSAAYYGTFSGWPIWDWYAWPRILLFYFAVVELMHCPPGLHRKGAIAALTLIFQVVPFTYLDQVNRGMSFGRHNARMAALFNASAAQGTTFAMGDRSGGFGYLLDDRFSFIQTEGLVADLAYLRALKANKGVEFLAEHGTDYFIVDRSRFWRFGSVYAIPEPSQGLSARTGVMLLCFPIGVELQDLSFTPDRKVFPYSKRVECPSAAASELQARQKLYRGVHMNSRWVTPRTGFFDGLE